MNVPRLSSSSLESIHDRWTAGRLFVLPLGLSLCLLLAACSSEEEEASANDDDSAQGDDDDSAAAEEQGESVTAVRIAEVRVGTISESIKVASTVLADRRADVVLETSGTVSAIRVEEGDRVRKGRVLAKLKNPQLSAERSRTSANFSKAQEDFTSVKLLHEQGYVARREYDDAKLALETARSTFRAAKEADGARNLKAPISGTVSLKDLRYGEAVSPGRLAFQIVDLDDLIVEVNLPERDLARLRVGQKALIRSELLEGVEAEGRVERISPVVDPQSGTVKVTVALAKDQERILPGMFVQVEVVVATHSDALLIPKVSLVYDEGVATVFRLKEDGVERVEIKKGFAGSEDVEALEGLDAGDQLVVAGQGLLTDGAKVRVVK